MVRNLVVPVKGVVGIVPAGIGLRTERVPGEGSTKRRRCGYSMTGWISRVRRLSGRDGKRRKECEHDKQECETERRQRMSEDAVSVLGEVRRSGGCIHD